MAKKENDSLTLEVETRLDDLFGDMDMLSSDSLNDGFSGTEELPLRDLKAIVLSIDWEISDQIMEDFVREVERLKDKYASDEILFMFFKLLISIGKYIRAKRASAHPDAIKLLISVYNSVEKVFLEEDINEEEKKNMLFEQANRFKKLKEQIASAKAAAFKKIGVSMPEPIEAVPAELEAIETELMEAAPAELETIETEPIEAVPAELEAIETEPIEAAPAELETIETEPIEAAPAEPETTETEPIEAETIDMKDVIHATVAESPEKMPFEISGEEQIVSEERDKSRKELVEELPSSDIRDMPAHEAFALALDEIKQVIKTEFSALRAEIKLWRQEK